MRHGRAVVTLLMLRARLQLPDTDEPAKSTDRPTVPAPAQERDSGVRMRVIEPVSEPPPSGSQRTAQRGEIEQRLLVALRARDAGASFMEAGGMVCNGTTS